MRRFIPFIAGVVLTGLVAYALHARAVRPTIDRVADAAIRPVESATPPLGLPRLHAGGWRVVGGREDRLGGRTVDSATYRSGSRVMTLSRMQDTDGLGMEIGGPSRKWGLLNVSFAERGGQLRGHTVVDGHHLVVTGTPASAAMRRELMRLVVLAGGRTAQ
jgi:hypothetical protein